MNYNINKLLEKAESYTSRKVAKSWEIEQELNEYELKDSDIEYLLSLER